MEIQPLIQINTKNILFICGGAFDGLSRIISARIGRRTMGFGAEVDHPAERNMGEIMAHVEPDDLIKYGLIPELVGRLPIVSALDDLDEEALLRILVEPKNAITKQYQKLFKIDGVELNFEEAALKRIVELTLQKGTGARGLRSVLEEVMIDLMYEVPSKTEVKSCDITEGMVLSRWPAYAVQKRA